VIYGIVGTVDDFSTGGSIRGNGKTNTMTYYGYQEYKQGKTVYSNYKTTFSQIVNLNDLMIIFKDKNLSNTTILLDEIQVYLPNQGVKKGIITDLIGKFVSQTRKREIDIFYTTQRFLNLNNQLRIHTDEIFLPVKTHRDGKQCSSDKCKKEHFIHVFSQYSDDAIAVLNAQKVGQLYNSNEIIFDTYISEEEQQKALTKKSP
jgi:hypothetical protein